MVLPSCQTDAVTAVLPGAFEQFDKEDGKLQEETSGDGKLPARNAEEAGARLAMGLAFWYGQRHLSLHIKLLLTMAASRLRWWFGRSWYYSLVGVLADTKDILYHCTWAVDGHERTSVVHGRM